ncbi:HEAT repeat domain-containing protein [Planctomycetota bacterium]
MNNHLPDDKDPLIKSLKLNPLWNQKSDPGLLDSVMARVQSPGVVTGTSISPVRWISALAAVLLAGIIAFSVYSKINAPDKSAGQHGVIVAPKDLDAILLRHIYPSSGSAGDVALIENRKELSFLLVGEGDEISNYRILKATAKELELLHTISNNITTLKLQPLNPLVGGLDGEIQQFFNQWTQGKLDAAGKEHILQLAANGDLGATALLYSMLEKDPQDNFLQSSKKMLYGSEGESAMLRLVEVALDKKHAGRKLVIKDLAHMPALAAKLTLRRIAADPSDTMRAQAVHSLGKLKDRTAAKLLETIIQNENSNPRLRREAEKALDSISRSN